MRSVNIRPVFTLTRGLQLTRLQIETVSCDGYRGWNVGVVCACRSIYSLKITGRGPYYVTSVAYERVRAPVWVYTHVFGYVCGLTTPIAAAAIASSVRSRWTVNTLVTRTAVALYFTYSLPRHTLAARFAVRVAHGETPRSCASPPHNRGPRDDLAIT